MNPRKNTTAYQYPFPPIPEGWTEDGKRFAYGLRHLFDILFARQSAVWKSADTWPGKRATADIQCVIVYGTKTGVINIPASELGDTARTFYTSFYDGNTLYKCKASASVSAATVDILEGTTDVTSSATVHFNYR